MHSLQASFLDTLQFTPAQASLLRALGEARGRQQLFERQRPETLTALRTVAMVESTDASNRIEGILATPARIRALVRGGAAPRNRSEREIAGYRDALQLIHDAGRDMPVSVNVVRQLHRTVYRYEPADGGAWKATDNRIVERDERGQEVRVRFRPVSAVATPQAMEDLFRGYRQTEQDARDPLLVIPLVVLDFLCIHPFREGNGRVARLLTLLLLYHADYNVGRYVSLERLFHDTRRSYYDTLEAASLGWREGRHDATPWMEYFWGILIRAYAELEERVGTVDRGRGSKSERVRQAVLRKVRPFGIKEIERDCPDVSRDTIRNVLRKMKQEGVIVPRGRGPGARWHPGQG